MYGRSCNGAVAKCNVMLSLNSHSSGAVRRRLSLGPGKHRKSRCAAVPAEESVASPSLAAGESGLLWLSPAAEPVSSELACSLFRRILSGP